MAQFARPDADTYNGDGWTEDDGDTVNMFQEIDETSPNDTDFVRSAVTPTSDAVVFRLSDVTDPVSSVNHIMRVRYSADQNAQETIDFTFQLRMTYVNEGSQGTLIVSKSVPGITSTTWVTDSTTLSGAEADAITDYTALFIRIVANKP
jgi:hypothetical protein